MGECMQSGSIGFGFVSLRTEWKLWRRVAVMVLAALPGLAVAGGAPSLIHFKSGATYEGEILGFENGIFRVQLSNGSRVQTRQENILKIEFVEPAARAIPPEFEMMAPAAVPAPTAPVAPPASPAAPVAAAPAPAKRIAPSTRLVLGSHWQMRLGRGNTSHRDVAHLLSGCGTPQVDLDGKAIDLWGSVTYLMPLDDARQALSLKASRKTPVTSSVFPPNSFFYHEFSGNFEDGFTKMFIVTDMDDQIVAVQFLDNSSRPDRWFPEYNNNYSTDWSLFNFLSDGKKANSNWQIGYYVCQGDKAVMGYPPRGGAIHPLSGGPTGVNERVIRVDSDLFSLTRDRWNIVTDAKSRQRVRIYLPQPVVDLMLYVAQEVR